MADGNVCRRDGRGPPRRCDACISPYQIYVVLGRISRKLGRRVYIANKTVRTNLMKHGPWEEEEEEDQRQGPAEVGLSAAGQTTWQERGGHSFTRSTRRPFKAKVIPYVVYVHTGGPPPLLLPSSARSTESPRKKKGAQHDGSSRRRWHTFILV